MTQHIKELIVTHNQIKVGLLLMGKKSIHFQYEQEWLMNGFNISPFDLKWDNSIQTPADAKMFEGLHGVFADSISDGWGKMLTDRALQKKFNWEKNEITQLDRLFFTGVRSMGGFEYFPNDDKDAQTNKINLENLFSETQKLISGEKEDIIKDLYLSGGSPGGARPKAIFARNGQDFVAGYGQIPSNYEAWLVKFFASSDNGDMGKIEKAYADMAIDCGIIFPQTELIRVKIKNKDNHFFAVKRFDRTDNQKLHVVSLSGLIYASHREPSVSYNDILNTTQNLTKSHQELKKMINIMVFNILAHNQDDHTKNFSFYRVNNRWEVTPAYDLVYSHALGNEHMSDIGGNGNPNHKNIVTLLKQFNENANVQIEKTIEVLSNWKHYANQYDIATKEINNINKKIKETIKNFNYMPLK